MGDTTGIAWTDHTWNPWQGCHKTSEGCLNCYMHRDKRRYGQDPTVVVRSSNATFRRPITWHKVVLYAANGGLIPKPELVFACSWSDFFIEEADPWRADAWTIIKRTPCLTYQILTKRAENIATRLPTDWHEGWANCWLGCTAENQTQADARLSLLVNLPAVLRFVSIEPILGLVDISPWLANGIAWVVCGAESGPCARPADPDWFRSLRDQCVAAGVPYFLKQMMVNGKLDHEPVLDGHTWREFPRTERTP